MSTTKPQTTIHIPTPLRINADNRAAICLEAETVGEALECLVREHPELKQHLYDEQGRLRSFVNVFRNDEDIRHLDRESTPLREHDELSIVPSIAGGI